MWVTNADLIQQHGTSTVDSESELMKTPYAVLLGAAIISLSLNVELKSVRDANAFGSESRYQMVPMQGYVMLLDTEKSLIKHCHKGTSYDGFRTVCSNWTNIE